jgi:hypothetical protein
MQHDDRTCGYYVGAHLLTVVSCCTSAAVEVAISGRAVESVHKTLESFIKVQYVVIMINLLK